MPLVHTALADLFGYQTFRPHQEAVVRAVLAGNDSFTVMPTGGGKSLCYQLPAYLMDGVAVVVSPLISLMKDQVDAARANGLRAATLNSTSLASERSAVQRALRDNALDLLYVSPERLRTPGFLDYLKSLPLSFFAIDEAHCISEWGHDFRPDYLALSCLAQEFPKLPIAAFTATATPQVAQDIINRLGLRAPRLTRASFNRPNLFYHVVPKENPDKQLLAFVREHEQESGIIYRTSRKSVESTVAMLRKNGIAAGAYHAGMPDAQRAASQDAFRLDECPVMVATIAFGMGIDKSNVRYVVHADLPKNLEGYYQETGRAGRDGDPAQCLLLFGRQDMAQLLFFARGIDDDQARAVAESQLYQMVRFAENDGCRRRALLAYFGENLPEDNCGGCDICSGDAVREDATVAAQKALSAMVRTGERFGAGHIAGILVGSKAERILANGHDLLPTYGVGKDQDRNYWRKVINALLSQGHARTDDPLYPVPAVTELGWQVLRGQTPFRMLRTAESTRERKKREKSAAVPEFSQGLFQQLRLERARLAQAGNVPPYVVFSDRTLHEMARSFPDTPEKLLAVPGVGQHKRDVYGAAFLAIIASYTAQHPEEQPLASVQPSLRVNAAPPLSSAGKDSKTATVDETGKLLAQGLGIEEAAAQRGLKPETILLHMEKLMEHGSRFPEQQFFSKTRLDEIEALFVSNNGWQLTPVVEGPPPPSGGISYPEARLARLLIRRLRRSETPS